MSLFNKFQKMFGFSSYEDEQFDAFDAETPTVNDSYAVQTVGVGTRPAPEALVEAPEPVDEDESLIAPAADPSVIFAGIVELLNKQLPPYLRENLDEEGQRKFILENLETSIKDYVHKIGEDERKKAQRMKEKDRDRMRKSFEETKEKLRLTEEKLEVETEKAMSAERQKRAMTGRITDLEGRIASLEAEREQFDLENRSLLNKLRVAEVTAQMSGGSLDMDAAVLWQQRLEEMENELKAVREEKEAIVGEAESDKESIAALQQAVATANAEKEQALAAERQQREELMKMADMERRLREAQSRCATLEADNDSLIQQNVELRRQMDEETARRQAEELRRVEMEATRKKEAADYQPSYEFISFEEDAAPAPAVDPAPVVAVEQSEAAPRPVEAIESEKADKKKKATRRSKSRKEQTDDFLTDTDWLVDAAAEMNNPDLVMIPQPVVPQSGRDFPAQMSLW